MKNQDHSKKKKNHKPTRRVSRSLPPEEQARILAAIQQTFRCGETPGSLERFHLRGKTWRPLATGDFRILKGATGHRDRKTPYQGWQFTYPETTVTIGDCRYQVRHHEIAWVLHHGALPPRGRVIDHIDGNILNNARENLRAVPSGENTRNTSRMSAGLKAALAPHQKDPRFAGWLAAICEGLKSLPPNITVTGDALRPFARFRPGEPWKTRRHFTTVLEALIA